MAYQPEINWKNIFSKEQRLLIAQNGRSFSSTHWWSLLIVCLIEVFVELLWSRSSCLNYPRNSICFWTLQYCSIFLLQELRRQICACHYLFILSSFLWANLLKSPHWDTSDHHDVHHRMTKRTNLNHYTAYHVESPL